MTKNQPYHETVAKKVIQALKDGTAPWIKPWDPAHSPLSPVNALTNQPAKYKETICLNHVMVINGKFTKIMLKNDVGDVLHPMEEL